VTIQARGAILPDPPLYYSQKVYWSPEEEQSSE